MPTGDRITSLSAANFKSIGREAQGIAIKPLTILAGANSSGKSTLMQPLLLVKQTLESSFDPGPLLLNGPNVKFTDANQYLSRVRGADHRLIEFCFQVGERVTKLEFSHTKSAGLTVQANEFGSVSGEFERIEANGTHRRVGRFKCFLLDPLSAPDGRPGILKKGYDSLPMLLQQVLHVPGIRGNPQRHYESTAHGPRFSGTFDPYAASVILHWQQNGGSSRLEILRRWLQVLDLTGSIEAKRLDDVSIEIRVGRLPGSSQKAKADMVSIADVGFGVSQVLPALVALLAADDTSLVYIEQPELHLHPNSQAHLASVLAEAAQGGPSVVVETHSSLLIQEIQTLIATGTLDRDHVALHWCSRDPKTGATKVATADLDKNGAYGEWPIDFDSVALESQGRYLDAVSRGLKH